jgi:tetratricopeptide (TPR) repeat protein
MKCSYWITGRAVIVLFVLAAATFIAFWPSLFNGFSNWDDGLLVVSNPFVTGLTLQNFPDLLTSMIGKTYVPLTVLSFSIEHFFFKLSPLFYHLDNLILHFGVVVLVWALALRFHFSAGAAFLAALIFAIHPMRVESVAWISERKDLLYAFFYMAAVHQYLSYIRSGKFLPYMGSLFFALLSILSKAMAVSLPLIFLLVDWYEKRPLSRRSLVDKAPFFMILLGIAAVTYVFNERIFASNVDQAILVWIWTFVFYLKTFLWPLNLSPLYQAPIPVSLWNVEYFSAIVVFVLFLSSLVLFRRNRLWLLACGYYFLSIFFLLRFNKDVLVSFVADRFMYLPALGFCLWIGYETDRWLNGLKQKAFKIRIAAWSLVTGVFLAGGSLTFVQCRIWGDDLKFWLRAVHRAPGYVSYINLAHYYRGRGMHQAAIGIYEKMLGQGDAREYWVLNDIGMEYVSLKDPVRAIEYYNRSLALNPLCADTYLLRAFLHQNAKRYDQAVEDYTRAVELEPRFALAYHNRAILYFVRQDLQAAIKDFSHAVEIIPDFVTAYYFRAQLYGIAGEYEKALADLDKALRIEPGYQSAIDLRTKMLGHPYERLPGVLDVPSDTFKRSQWDPFAYKNYMSDRERIYNLTGR